LQDGVGEHMSRPNAGVGNKHDDHHAAERKRGTRPEIEGSAMSREITSKSQNHRVLQRYIEIMNSGDPDRLWEVLDSAYIQVIPQSGEVLRGIEDFAQVMRNWPSGGFQRDSMVGAQVVSAVDHELVSTGIGPFPTYNLIRIEGEGDTLTSYSLVRYPDGQVWFDISIATLHAGKIVKELLFFGPRFETPAWRSKWAHAMTPEEQVELVGFEMD